MKFSLLCLALVCTAATANPTAVQETGKSAERLFGGQETEPDNRRVERDDQSAAASESGEKGPKTDADVERPNSASDKPKSPINQGNPNIHSSKLTSVHNPDSSYPAARSAISIYPQSSSYGSYGLGSGSYGSYGSGSYGSYGSGSYGSYGSGSYGPYGSGLYAPYGLGYGSYGIRSGSYGPYGIGSGAYGLYESGSESCGQSDYGALIGSNIPTSLAGAIPHRGGINIAQQIIHKPIITEMQEIIHKPIITELQEIINKPIVSDVQQIIHRPLYTEHIELGPSYHGYQKHIIKQPFYQKLKPHYLHHPMIHAGTINLPDEYDHAVTTTTTTHSICPPGLESSYGLTGATLPASYGSGIIGLSTGYSSIGHGSSPYRYVTAPSVSASYNYVAPASNVYSAPNFLGSIPQPSYGHNYMFNNGIREPFSYRNVEEKSQPKATEQITYDELEPYKPQSNGNQQYYDNPSQGTQQLQQLGRSSEESKKIKIDVDAIANQIEKNPDMKKQLIKIITESMYVSDQMAQSGRKQSEKTM